MKRTKYLLIALAIIIMLTGCEIIPFIPSGEMSLDYNPNPAYNPFYTSTYGWTWTVNVKIEETGGMDITLGNYGPGNAACVSKFLTDDNQLVSTDVFYASDIEEFFGTLVLPANGSISHSGDFSTLSYDQGKFVETYYGIDENGVIVNCTDTLKLINNTKK